MKYVVDISENRLEVLRMFYKDCQENLSTSDIAIVEGKPLDSVLGEIRAEIKHLRNFRAETYDLEQYCDNFDARIIFMDDVLQIIDKYKEGSEERK